MLRPAPVTGPQLVNVDRDGPVLDSSRAGESVLHYRLKLSVRPSPLPGAGGFTRDGLPDGPDVDGYAVLRRTLALPTRASGRSFPGSPQWEGTHYMWMLCPASASVSAGPSRPPPQVFSGRRDHSEAEPVQPSGLCKQVPVERRRCSQLSPASPPLRLGRTARRVCWSTGSPSQRGPPGVAVWEHDGRSTSSVPDSASANPSVQIHVAYSRRSATCSSAALRRSPEDGRGVRQGRPSGIKRPLWSSPRRYVFFTGLAMGR